MSAVLSFAIRDYRVVRSYRIPFVGAIAAAGLSLITFRFMARLVGDAEAIRGTGDYFAFAVVGMAVAQVVQRTMTAPPAVVRQEQLQGTLEILGTRPIGPWKLSTGWSAFPVLESILIATATLVIGWTFGLPLTVARLAMALPALAAVAIAFAGCGLAAAALILAFQRGASVPRWLAAGLAFISGVLFPVSLLPGWLGTLAQLSPLTHALGLLRSTLLTGVVPAGDALLVVASAAVLYPLGAAAIAIALDRARRTGSLGTY